MSDKLRELLVIVCQSDSGWRFSDYNWNRWLDNPPPHRPFAYDRVSICWRNSLLTFNVSAQATMKSAAKCDTHCEMQISVNQLDLERKLCLQILDCKLICIIISHRMQQYGWEYCSDAARYDYTRQSFRAYNDKARTCNFIKDYVWKAHMLSELLKI